MGKITVLLVDDYKLVTEACAFVLNNDKRFRVIGEAADATEAYRIVKEKAPRIALVDINMSPVNGFEITRKISRLSAVTKVIGLSLYNNIVYAKKMMQLGAMGYVTKNSSKEELMTAIVKVNKGNKYICQEIKDLLAKVHLEKDSVPDIPVILTKSELAIAHAVKDGFSSKQIAGKLNISIKTVEVHRHNILTKLKLKNSAALVNYINEQRL
jgi:DNA-binding NarL/FixJ family response regulator